MWALDKGNGKSVGEDSIGYPMLRRLPFTTKCTLLNIINRIWKDGVVPDQWKTGLVIPIPKPGKNHKEVDRYRPITLLSCVGKLIEHMVNRRLITQLEGDKRLDRRQYAFRSGKGIDSYLADLENVIHEPLESGEHCEAALLDLSKAYDSAWRYPIMTTLASWGFRGRIMKFIKSFLINRSFKVTVGGTTSTIRTQENGVPQGSVLSVTLFLVSLHDIFNVIPRGCKICKSTRSCTGSQDDVQTTCWRAS